MSYNTTINGNGYVRETFWNFIEEEADLLLHFYNINYKDMKLDNNQHINFFKKYKLISFYTTFILDEPIHPVGMPFPGGFKVKYENGTYYSPVKENQKDNPGAVCEFWIAEQDENVKKQIKWKQKNCYGVVFINEWMEL